jgi:hypothetical protein
LTLEKRESLRLKKGGGNKSALPESEDMIPTFG